MLTNSQKCQVIIDAIHQTMNKPNYKPETSNQMRDRAKRLSSTATSLKIMGIGVKDAYH